MTCVESLINMLNIKVYIFILSNSVDLQMESTTVSNENCFKSSDISDVTSSSSSNNTIYTYVVEIKVP